jgi:hypothetical protein
MVVRVNHRMPEHANPLPPRILLDDMEYAHPMVRPRYLAWPRHLAPADPPHSGDGMRRGSTGGW